MRHVVSKLALSLLYHYCSSLGYWSGLTEARGGGSTRWWEEGVPADGALGTTGGMEVGGGELVETQEILETADILD